MTVQIDHPSEDNDAEISSARLKYLASQIHKLGPRPLYELLCELSDGNEFAPALAPSFTEDDINARVYSSLTRVLETGPIENRGRSSD